MIDSAVEDLLNVVRREAGRADTLRRHSQTLLVTSYDPGAHAVKGKYQPDGKESGWVPVGVIHVGNGYGIIAGPSPGDQFEVGFRGGDVESPYIITKLFSDDDKPPRVESGEILVKHKDGASVSLAKDGSTTVTNANGCSTVMDKDKNITTKSPDGKVKLQSGQMPVVVTPQKVKLATADSSSQDEKLKDAIKAKAQADLAADPNRASVNMSTTLPSGKSYSYTVSRN